MEGWRKSSYSDGNGGDCVETASGSGVIVVRDTADRDGVTLSVPTDSWQAVHRLARPRMIAWPSAWVPGVGATARDLELAVPVQ